MKCYINEHADLFVFVNVNTLQLTESNKISSNQNTQFSSLLFTLVTIPCVTLMLHSNPKLVHLRKVQQNEVNGIQHCSTLVVISRISKMPNL